MTQPQRIQLRRTAGWRKPEGAIVVARPTKWGNPWRVGASRGERLPPYDAASAVARYRNWLTTRIAQPSNGVARAVILRDLEQLRGRDVACWCPLDQPCHGDVLLDLANPVLASANTEDETQPVTAS